MKKNSSPLTKQDMQHLTQEITALTKEVSTIKHDVKSVRNELSVMELRSDIKLDKLEMAINDKTKQYRDDVLTKLDGVMGELEKIRLDREIGTHQAIELQKQANIFEKRLKKFEQTRQAA